jgi:hypothetical protein
MKNPYEGEKKKKVGEGKMKENQRKGEIQTPNLCQLHTIP